MKNATDGKDICCGGCMTNLCVAGRADVCLKWKKRNLTEVLVFFLLSTLIPSRLLGPGGSSRGGVHCLLSDLSRLHRAGFVFSALETEGHADGSESPSLSLSVLKEMGQLRTACSVSAWG